MNMKHLFMAAGILGTAGAVYYFVTRPKEDLGAIAMNPGHYGAIAMNPGHYGAIAMNPGHYGAVEMSGAHDLGAIHTAGFGSVELSGAGAGAAF